MDREKMKSVLESVLFVWGEPLEAGLAAEVLQTGREEALSLLEELCEDYENRKGGIRIQRMENAFQFYTPGENHEFLQRLTGTDKEKKLIDGIAYQVREECFDPYERSIYTRQYTFNDINGNILHVNTTPSEKRIITATEKDIVDIMIINQVMHYYQLKN